MKGENVGAKLWKVFILTAAFATIVIVAFGVSSCSLDCPNGLVMHYSINSTKPNGDPWDFLGGPDPDPRGMVTITNPDGVIFKESIALRSDLYDFNGFFFRKKGIAIKNGAKIVVYLVDDDAAFDDPIGTSDYVFSRINSILNGGTDSFSANSFSGSLKCNQ